MRSKPPHPLSKEEIWLTQLTQSRFAWQVNATTDLPDPIRLLVVQLLTVDEAVEQMIVAPFQGKLSQQQGKHFHRFRIRWTWEFTPDWVVVQTTKRLLLIPVDEHGDPGTVSCVSIDAILFVQLGTVLLSSWLEICWVEEGTCQQQRIYFNTVSENLFRTLVQEIRCRSVGYDIAPYSIHPQRKPFEALPYKFQYTVPARHLLQGEPVARVVYRPAMWKKTFGCLRQQIASRMVVVQTSTHLIFVEEELFGNEGAYGLIATYISLPLLQSMVVKPGENRLDLVVNIGEGFTQKELVFPFPKDMENELYTLQDWKNG